MRAIDGDRCAHLLSVSDKTGLVPVRHRALARAAGGRLVSTGGTATGARGDAGLPVIGISDVTGFPEMMDGRVKTLHPKVHGGILARRHRADDLASLAAHGITPIDLVVVNLYPFAEGGGASRTLPFDDLDRGDRHRRSEPGARGRQEFPRRARGCRPGDYDRVLAAACAPDGPALAFRFDLARRAIRAHGRLRPDDCDDARATFAWTKPTASSCASAPAARRVCPTIWQPTLTKLRDLRYGENPHQAGAWYRDERRSGFGGGDRPPGQGTVVHEPARSRRGRAHRARVRRAGGGRHQAHESVRRRDRRHAGRGVRARARGRCAVGVWRHRRPQSADRRRDGARADVHVHRSGGRAGSRGR